MSLIYLKCISPAHNDALSLEEVKLYLKIDHEWEDDLLKLLIKSAVKKCENYTNKVLIHQQWCVVYEKINSIHLVLRINSSVRSVRNCRS